MILKQRSIWSLYKILTGTTSSVKCGPGSNDNEGIFHISQNSRIGVSPSNSV